jgi:hypothetical protein
MRDVPRRRAAPGRGRTLTVPAAVERTAIAAGVTLVFVGLQLAVVALIVGGALALPVRLLQTGLFALAPWVLAALAGLVGVSGCVCAVLLRRRVSVPLLDQILAGVHAVGANLALAGMVLSCWYGFPTAPRATAVGHRHAQLIVAVVAGAAGLVGWLHFRAFDASVAKSKDDDSHADSGRSRVQATGSAAGGSAVARLAAVGASKGPSGGGGCSGDVEGAAAAALPSDSDDDRAGGVAGVRPPVSPRRAPTLEPWTATAHLMAPLLVHVALAAALCSWFTAYAAGPTPEFWTVVGDMSCADWSGVLRRAAVSAKLGGHGDRLGVGAV